VANPDYVVAQLGGVDAGLKRTLVEVFRYVLGNLRLGRPSTQTRAENLQAYFLYGTTPSVALQEFSIAHGLGAAPYLLLPVLDLQGVGAQIVPLVVTRAADASRIYLASSATDAAIAVLVEAPGV
jgi:hypothetical protein